MAINRDKPNRWKIDIAKSVDLYNCWFMEFAPKAFRSTRARTAKDVEDALKATQNLTDISPALLKKHPLRYYLCSECQHVHPLLETDLLDWLAYPKTLLSKWKMLNCLECLLKCL